MSERSPGHARFGAREDDDAGEHAFDHFNGLLSVDDERSPYPLLAELRASGPVHPGMPDFGLVDTPPGAPPTFSVYSYDLVSQILADHETFSSSPYGGMIGVIIGRSLLEMDEPEHRTYRLILQQAFSRAEMRRWEAEAVRPLIAGTIDHLATRGDRRADLVRDLCLPFPVKAIAQLLGLPPDDHERFQRLAIELIAVTVDWDRAVAAAATLQDYFAEVLADRRRAPQHDMISVLAHAEADGQRLSDDDVFAFLRLLLPAGAETTYRVSSSLLCALLSDPEQLELVRADRSLLTHATEEAVRWEAPLQFVPRLATRDIELGGVAIAAGANINCHIGAANRDPQRFEDPDRFDLRRDRRTGVGFGYGVHTCLGMHLAKMETVAVVDLLLDALPDVHLDAAQPRPFVGGTIMRSAPRLAVAW